MIKETEALLHSSFIGCTKKLTIVVIRVCCGPHRWSCGFQCRMHRTAEWVAPLLYVGLNETYHNGNQGCCEPHRCSCGCHCMKHHAKELLNGWDHSHVEHNFLGNRHLAHVHHTKLWGVNKENKHKMICLHPPITRMEAGKTLFQTLFIKLDKKITENKRHFTVFRSPACQTIRICSHIILKAYTCFILQNVIMADFSAPLW